MKPIVQIIILNWKKPQDTIKCLESLERLSYASYGIILIDNNSEDDSVELIRKWLNRRSFTFNEHTLLPNSGNNLQAANQVKFNFILNHENSGFAKGNNIGIQMAIDLGSPYVLLLNNDTEVEGDFLNILMDHKKKFPEYSILTPQIRLFNPKDIIWNCGGKLVLGGFWKRYHYSRKHINELDEEEPIKQITFVTGCALLYKPDEMGLLSEDFFFGEEDFEFSLRAKKMGKKIGCVLNSIIYHKVGTSLNAVNSIEKRYIHLLNRLINTRKNNFNIFWPFLAIGAILLNFSKLLTKEKMKFRDAVFYSWNLLKDAFFLNEVNQKKFIEVVHYKRW